MSIWTGKNECRSTWTGKNECRSTRTGEDEIFKKIMHIYIHLLVWSKNTKIDKQF